MGFLGFRLISQFHFCFFAFVWWFYIVWLHYLSGFLLPHSNFALSRFGPRLHSSFESLGFLFDLRDFSISLRFDFVFCIEWTCLLSLFRYHFSKWYFYYFSFCLAHLALKHWKYKKNLFLFWLVNVNWIFFVLFSDF